MRQGFVGKQYFGKFVQMNQSIWNQKWYSNGPNITPNHQIIFLIIIVIYSNRFHVTIIIRKMGSISGQNCC